MYCKYYQALVPRERTWFLVGILRSFEHLLFERTVDKQSGLFEFLVPEGLESYFLDLMKDLEQRGVIQNLVCLPNRFMMQ